MDINTLSGFNMVARTISPPPLDGQPPPRRAKKPLPQIPPNIDAVNATDTQMPQCQWVYSAAFPMQQVYFQQPHHSYGQVPCYATQQPKQPSRNLPSLTASKQNSNSARRHSFSEAIAPNATFVHMPHDIVARNASFTNLAAYPVAQPPPPPYGESLKVETSSHLPEASRLQKPFEPAASSSRELHSPNTPDDSGQLRVSTSNLSSGSSSATLLSPSTPSNTSTPKELIPAVSLHSPVAKIPSPWGSMSSLMEPLKPEEREGDDCKNSCDKVKNVDTGSTSPSAAQPILTERHVPDQRTGSVQKRTTEMNKVRQQSLSSRPSKFSCIASYSLTHNKDVIKTYRRMAKKIKDVAVQLAYAKYLLDIVHLLSSSKDKDPCVSLLVKEARFWIERLAKKKEPEALYIKGQWRLHGTMYGRANKKKALLCFTLSAKAGWPPAYYQLGEYYAQQGQYSQAVSSYQAAADKGHPQALYRLSMLLLSQKLDIPKGLEYLKQAAEASDVSAARPAYVLSSLYSGCDVETIPSSSIDKDETTAFQLLKKSARLGHVEAIYQMGQVFTHGLLGQPRDPWQGYQNFVRAAEEKHKGAMLELAKMFEKGIPEHLDAEAEQAFRWCKKAADSGYTEAEYVLGTYYEDGMGTCRDYPQALKYFGKATSKGHALAARKLNLPVTKMPVTNNISQKPQVTAGAVNTHSLNKCGIM